MNPNEGGVLRWCGWATFLQVWKRVTDSRKVWDEMREEVEFRDVPHLTNNGIQYLVSLGNGQVERDDSEHVGPGDAEGRVQAVDEI